MKINKILAIGITLFMVLILSNCVKEDFNVVPNEANDVMFENMKPNMTIAELKAKFPTNTVIKDTTIIIGVTVTSSDKEGNIYKTLYVQDSTGGMGISIDKQDMYWDYPVGQLIYVKCDGLYISYDKYGPNLSYFSQAVQMSGSIPGQAIGKTIYKVPGGQVITPKVKRISELGIEDLNTIIRIEDVQFLASDTALTYGKIFSPLVANLGSDRYVEDFEENTIVLRISDFATFALDSVPRGRGNLTVIYSDYKSNKQLLIRDLNDITFNQTAENRIVRNYLVEEEFDGSLGGFTPFDIAGSANWYAAAYQTNNYANISGYKKGVNEDWLISPNIDLSTESNALFSFKHAINYHTASTWDDVQVLISTDYDGTSDPTTQGTWTQVTDYTQASGSSWTFVNSGGVSLNQYIGMANVHIAFRYTCTDTDAANWEIDNFKVITE